MFETYFYHKTIETYTGVFGYLFKDLKILSNNKMVKVPIEFKAKSKSLDRRDKDLEKTKIRTTLPRMVFNLASYDKDLSRKTNKILKMVSQPNNNVVKTQLNRVPYEFTFELDIKTKEIGELTQIIEQICPYFADPISIDIKDNPDISDDTSISIKLITVQDDINAISTYDEYRTVEARLTFILSGYMYMPTSEQNKITKVVINYGDLETDLLYNNEWVELA